MSNSFSQSPNKRFKLDSLRYWEVNMMPTERKEVAGHMMPTLRGSIAKLGTVAKFKGKRMRITIETYTPQTPEESAKIRIRHSSAMNEKSFNKLMAGRSSRTGFQADQLGEDDMVIFRMFKAKPTTAKVAKNTTIVEDGEWDIEESTDDISMDHSNDKEGREFRWHEKFRMRLFYVNIISSNHKTCRLQLGVGSETKVRTITFDSEADLESFKNVCHAMKELQKERADRLATEFKEKNLNHTLKSQGSMNDESETDTPDLVHQPQEAGDHEDNDDESSGPRLVHGLKSIRAGLKENGLKSLRPKVLSPSEAKVKLQTAANTIGKMATLNKQKGSKISMGDAEGETLNLLVEIVSACNLPAADKRSRKSDPYVRILDGTTVVHKTKHITKNLNPVWTLSQNCFFLYQQGVDEFFETQELLFEVRDWDAIGKDTTLGTVTVNKQDLLKGDGERMEYKLILNSEFTAENDEATLLAIRFRQATPHDINFMRMYTAASRRKDKRAVFQDETVVAPIIHKEVKIPGLKQLKKEKHGTTKFLVKPGPDPDRTDSTKWMNYYEIESEVVEPSREWIEAGSGKQGKLYVEVLSCDDLPNLDFSITGLDKTDPFVCLVYGDAIGHTDVLNDLLSPRWMPWTQRAFVFNISHPNSQLFVGVFDYDATDPNHDVVGRATCNITNFHPDTIYTVKYKLHSVINFEKVVRGYITLRIRVEWNNPRKTLLSGYSLSREPEYISVSKKSTFRTVSFTLTEEPSPYKLSLNSMSSYINELWTYWDFSYIYDYVMCLFLWKSHFKIQLQLPVIKERTLYIPLRSMTAFAWGIALTINFELFPSFLAFSVASVLIATLDAQATRASPWERPRGIVDLCGVLLFNKSSRFPRITEFDDQDKIQQFEALEKAIKKSQEEVLEAYYEESNNFYEEAAETSFGAADVNMATQTKGMSDILMKPFVPTLLPVQLWLHWFCRIFRITKGIVMWRDSYTAFWIVFASVATSFVFAFLPWSFILKLALKIFVWVFLGPWMKLADIFYFKYKPRYEKTPEEIEEDLKDELKELSNQWSGFSKDRKILFEKAAKDKDMKTYMFGGYVMPVPTLKEEFEYDNPILGSTAEPADSEYGKTLCDVKIVNRKYGQQLFGTMIPMREKDMIMKRQSEMGLTGIGAIDESLKNLGINESIKNLGIDESIKQLGFSKRSLGAISEGDEDLV